ncbi:Seg1p SCDLUD_004026 [Saccharomycodes ludwigii]|uniref:Seg1p n=1 Tax=Saccharomycodes ludwigii TaxID=36035 RepID=UPI001E824989|nr:hypothetical protein SCDLUD_004026 [Saccharomycodes ludwigii]KAH3899740.1 hypothetical protein SCDLUD_004026 [Saccharomycodes ludwigii]
MLHQRKSREPVYLSNSSNSAAVAAASILGKSLTTNTNTSGLNRRYSTAFTPPSSRNNSLQYSAALLNNNNNGKKLNSLSSSHSNFKRKTSVRMNSISTVASSPANYPDNKLKRSNSIYYDAQDAFDSFGGPQAKGVLLKNNVNTSSNSNKSKTIKKYVPSGHGLVLVEVNVEEAKKQYHRNSTIASAMRKTSSSINLRSTFNKSNCPTTRSGSLTSNNTCKRKNSVLRSSSLIVSKNNALNGGKKAPIFTDQNQSSQDNNLKPKGLEIPTLNQSTTKDPSDFSSSLEETESTSAANYTGYDVLGINLASSIEEDVILEEQESQDEEQQQLTKDNNSLEGPAEEEMDKKSTPQDVKSTTFKINPIIVEHPDLSQQETTEENPIINEEHIKPIGVALSTDSEVATEMKTATGENIGDIKQYHIKDTDEETDLTFDKELIEYRQTLSDTADMLLNDNFIGDNGISTNTSDDSKEGGIAKKVSSGSLKEPLISDFPLFTAKDTFTNEDLSPKKNSATMAQLLRSNNPYLTKEHSNTSSTSSKLKKSNTLSSNTSSTETSTATTLTDDSLGAVLLSSPISSSRLKLDNNKAKNNVQPSMDNMKKPIKSALKNSSSLNARNNKSVTNESGVSAADDIYLRLATAENTRLNAQITGGSCGELSESGSPIKKRGSVIVRNSIKRNPSSLKKPVEGTSGRSNNIIDKKNLKVTPTQKSKLSYKTPLTQEDTIKWLGSEKRSSFERERPGSNGFGFKKMSLRNEADYEIANQELMGASEGVTGANNPVSTNGQLQHLANTAAISGTFKSRFDSDSDSEYDKAFGNATGGETVSTTPKKKIKQVFDSESPNPKMTGFSGLFKRGGSTNGKITSPNKNHNGDGFFTPPKLSSLMKISSLSSTGPSSQVVAPDTVPANNIQSGSPMNTTGTLRNTKDRKSAVTNNAKGIDNIISNNNNFEDSKSVKRQNRLFNHQDEIRGDKKKKKNKFSGKLKSFFSKHSEQL